MPTDIHDCELIDVRLTSGMTWSIRRHSDKWIWSLTNLQLQTDCEIAYCPFCGEKLEVPK